MSNVEKNAEDIFFQALDIKDLEVRADYLKGACDNDFALYDRVQALLSAHEDAGSFLIDSPEADPATRVQPPILTEKPGTMIGPYKLLQQIGEGGFGIVFMAEQTEPVRRKVALKIIKPGMDTKDVIARFEAERQALALMDHPNIARVFDAGATEQGRPYFVMELVKGVPIHEYCDKNNLPTNERLELFQTVCHAIQHAHHKGIIHRDLKPSNIMVTLHDGKPVPRVIDFGVAKATSYQLTEKTLFTAYGQMMGTPAYMSPEQAEMSGLDIDTRSDIYSLGVLLYELLTGKTPFDGKHLRSAGYAEMQRIIREDQPPKPSTKLSSMGNELTVVSKHRSTNAKKLEQLLRGDLDWIVMKAMEKDRNRRYESASLFAADVGRYLSGDIVFARSPSIGYRMRKFARRNKGAFVTATMIFLALVAGTTASTWQAIVASHQRDRAVEAENDAKQQKDRAKQALKETRKTIDKYVETVRNAELLKEERFKPLMKELLNDALAHYTNFIEKHEHDDAEISDLAHALFRVAMINDEIGNTQKAIEAYRRTIGIRKKLVEENPTVTEYQNDLADSHNNIGILYGSTGKPDEALVSYKKALEIRAKLLADNPTVTGYQNDLAGHHNNIGLLYHETGKPDEALVSYKKAFEIEEKLVEENPTVTEYQSDLASSHYNIGILYGTTGKPDDALKSHKKALAIREKLVEENPTVTEYQNGLARIYHNIGKLYKATGKPDEALVSNKKAIKIQEKLVVENPTMTEYQSDLANSHNNIGILYGSTGKPDEALVSYKKAIEIEEKLVEDNPTVTVYQNNLAGSHNNIGLLYESTGQPDETLVSYKKALEIQEKLVEENPSSIGMAIDLGGSYVNSANLASSQKDYETAATYYEHGVKTLSKVVNSNPRHPIARLFLRNAHWGRAKLRLTLERFDEAVADWEKAIEYDSGQSRNYFRQRLALTLVAFAKTEKYQLAYMKSQILAEKNKTHAEIQYNLACAISRTCATAKRDKTLSSNERTERTNRYASKAIGLLKTAKKLGFFKDPNNQKLIQTDKDLDAIRDREEFQKLLKEIAADSPAKQDKKREKKTDLNNKDDKPLIAPRPKLVATKPGG